MTEEEHKGQPGSRTLGTSGVIDRLIHIRKRKRAFGGQKVSMEAIRQQVEDKGRKRDG
jgi:hypothetical protein